MRFTAKKREIVYRRRITSIFWCYRFTQSRYRQKTRNRLPSKNYRHIALPLRLCPPNKALPRSTQENLRTCYIPLSCNLTPPPPIQAHTYAHKTIPHCLAKSGRAVISITTTPKPKPLPKRQIATEAKSRVGGATRCPQKVSPPLPFLRSPIYSSLSSTL